MSLAMILLGNGLTPIAQDIALEIKDAPQRSEALIRIVESLSRTGPSDRIRDAELLARKAAYQVENRLSQSVALSSSAKELTKLDLLDEASMIAESIANPVNRSAALAAIAKALARKHRFYDARVIAESCDQASDRLDAFTSILGEHAKMTNAHFARWINELETQQAPPSIAQSGSPNL